MTDRPPLVIAQRGADRPPLVIAHRGASAYRPENTLPAYDLAVRQGADMIEIDLHLTRDGEVVVAHDAELPRIGGKGEIANATLAEIRALDAGDGERMPTLDEVLDGFAAQIPFNLELKRATDRSYQGLEARALEALRSRNLVERTLFSSFFDPALRELRALSAEARLAVLVSPRAPDGAVARARAVGAEAINPHFVLAQPALIDEAHGEGLAVYVYTVDDLDQMQRLIALGVDGIFTNAPDRMRSLVGATLPT